MTTFERIRAVVYSILFAYIIYLSQPYSQSEIDKDIKPHYDEFMSLVNKNCKENQYFHPNFKIEFKDLTDDTIGVCMIYPRSFIIHLDRKFWNSHKDLARFQILSHELTHCLFFQDHVYEPNHYMTPYFTDTPRDILYKQINELLQKHCS